MFKPYGSISAVILIHNTLVRKGRRQAWGTQNSDMAVIYWGIYDGKTVCLNCENIIPKQLRKMLVLIMGRPHVHDPEQFL